jgi:S1-C subfamily serine protease
LFRILLCFSFFLLARSGNAYLPDEKNSIDIYQKINPAVVNVTTTMLQRDFFLNVIPQKGLGSGVIIRPDGYILTNEHVIGQAVDVQVTLSDKSILPAKVVGRDPDSDLAVIKIESKVKKLPTVDFGTWESLAVGQKVLAIGNPFGLGGSLTVGVVSSLGRDIRASDQSPVIKDVIQTDASINPGNSGGPLLDSSGKLIGINAQIFSQSGGSEGIGFAISIKTLKQVVPQLIEFGQVLRPWLGLEGVGLPRELLSYLGVPSQYGVMLVDLYEDSPAAKAGLKPATKELVFGFRSIPVGGDVVYKIDKTPITTTRDILDYIAEKKTGDTITIYYCRGSSKRTASVKLTLPPNSRAKSL